MRAYSHPLITKTLFLAELEKHQREDRLVQGIYWDAADRIGCAVGCAYNSLASVIKGLPPPHLRIKTIHRDLSQHLCLDEDLLLVEDDIFESLPRERAIAWPLQFAEAIPEGADTSGIVAALMAMVLRHYDTGPEWRAISIRVADGIDAGWGTGQWLFLRSEYPPGDWGLPVTAVNYLLARARGDSSFVRHDALASFFCELHSDEDGEQALETAEALLDLLRAAPIGRAEVA